MKLDNILKPWLNVPSKDFSCVCDFFGKKFMWLLLFACVSLHMGKINSN